MTRPQLNNTILAEQPVRTILAKAVCVPDHPKQPLTKKTLLPDQIGLKTGWYYRCLQQNISAQYMVKGVCNPLKNQQKNSHMTFSSGPCHFHDKDSLKMSENDNRGYEKHINNYLNPFGNIYLEAINKV